MQRALVTVFFALFTHVSLAQTPACQSPDHRQFDFWQGEWQVEAQGKIAGTNTITVELNSCVLHEHYVTPSGYEGNSYNIFDQQTRLWHQTWVDNSGLLLQLKGQWNGQSMILSGKGKNATGDDVTHMITWTPAKDGTVRQHWQISTDDGNQWNTAFDGTYHRISASQ